MKAGRKLLLERTLMVLSIALLMLLEAYWLNNELREQYRRLRRDTGVALRVTVMQEQVKKYINAKGSFDLQFATGSVQGDFDIKTDSIENLVKHTDSGLQRIFADSIKNANINVIVAEDSTDAPPPPRLFLFDQERQMQEADNYTRLVAGFPVGKNVHVADVERKYREALHEAGVSLSFTMKKLPADSIQRQHHAGGRGKTLTVNRIENEHNGRMRRFNANADYLEATFENPFWYLVGKISWQLFFGLIMLAVTATAFVFLYRSLLQQQRLAAIKSDLISNITHELKTPIATVSVAIEALKNFDAISDAAKTKTYLDISAAELQRLNLLVDRVLKLSLFEQEQISLQLENVDLQPLLNEVLGSMKLQFEKHAAFIELKISGSGFFVKADRMHLVGVFYNLLDNALKYSAGNPEIGISLLKEDGKVCVSISDIGIGIPAAYHKKVFEKFFRVPHGDTHNIKGYGLGLSYVHEVIKRHGGEILVNSHSPQGTVFTIKLPIANNVSAANLL